VEPSKGLGRGPGGKDKKNRFRTEGDWRGEKTRTIEKKQQRRQRKGDKERHKLRVGDRTGESQGRNRREREARKTKSCHEIRRRHTERADDAVKRLAMG